ncbi:MAG: hypothetical protein M1482_14300 [Chloroflexi bacterium]|nr:hypothetical protein [Chloroflexota bacterium]
MSGNPQSFGDSDVLRACSGRIREIWGRLTASDLETALDSQDGLVRKIQEKYLISRDEARRQLDDFIKVQISLRPRTRTAGGF